MRFHHPGGSTVHLSYCSNVHPAEDVDGIVAQLSRFAGPLREAIDTDRLGLGLWVPAQAARELLRDRRALARLRAEIATQRLEVVTLNGFPYGGFHAPVVKRAVYRPDWTEPERLSYTIDLARLLAHLLPDDIASGSISTLPLGWRQGWSERSTAAALDALADLATQLVALEDETGRTIRIGLEPEPGCIVEETGQATALLKDLAPTWVGICLDACHLAVQFEEPASAIAAVADSGVPIVKAQISSALRVTDPGSAAGRAALAAFVEPRFLHQTRERGRSGRVEGADDLDEALAGALPGGREWRVHFHAPVHWGGGETTQPELRRTLDALVGGPALVTTHLDVETYTWTVLPLDQRPADDAGLVAGMARELVWTRDRLIDLGLKEDLR